jgi:hypothetical protein
MTDRQYTFGVSGNPIVQILGLIGFGVILIGAILMGTVILAAIIGLVMIGAIAFALRIWWLRWKLRRAAARGEGGREGEARDTRVIEVEYRVLDERELRDKDSSRRD